MVFADKLQSLRKSKGLSQEELAEEHSVQREISPYESYVGKWVRVFLKDREFNGFHCVALVTIQNSDLVIMNDKGKLGLIDGYSVGTISDFADKKKQMKLPSIPGKESIEDISHYFVGKKCDVRLKQANLLLGIGFNKPGGFYSVIVESISNDKVIVNDLYKRKHTARLSDILYIKEC